MSGDIGRTWWPGSGTPRAGGDTRARGGTAAGRVGAARGNPRPGGVKLASLPDRSRTDLRFSSHASQRLAVSGRKLSPVDLERLGQAVDRLAAKGARKSLLLLPDLALLVNVSSRTVITALDGGRVIEGVFLGIDSAAVL